MTLLPPQHGLSLYLHIPFCRTRCTYCDFNIYTNLRHLYEPYTEALCLEVERTLSAIARRAYHPLMPLPPVPETDDALLPLYIETVFLGGGTPSLLSPTLLGRIMASIRRFGTIRDDAEITLEANPGTLNLEKLKSLRVMGINRLSYGAQTFDDAQLKKLGRAHDSAEIGRSFALARESGFDNISLDFIYGLPGETLESWRDTLDKALALEAEHLSLYGLIVEENTSLGKRVLAGKLPVPEDDTAADMYLLALENLAQAGYVQYEISNWARGSLEKYASRHNLTYWLNRPYIGFGPGAHSCFAGYRFAVLKDPREYIQRIQAGESVIDTTEAEEVTPELKRADTVILAWRTNAGLDLQEFKAEFGKPLDEFYPGKVARFLELGLLEEGRNAADHPILRLTVRGRLLSNNVFVEFLPGD
ncbi:radical SAM family heme chaperone HemW [Candidatus Chlorohelix sp.]|uniref:radical SAM family heme chaperone HemW n=1 Tax=Candidatus Chlorohelix sp. TaxID=3139201 RepID=UPI003040BAC1